jgi:subtilase family serine protease
VGPGDLAVIYDIQALYSIGFDGSGQKLVVVGQTDISLPDIRMFRQLFSLPARDPELILVGSDPGVRSADQIEASLDIEWAGGIARNATILYVYSGNVLESLQYAVDQRLAPVVSMSYGTCENGAAPFYRALAQQANAEGITWINSSGDSGAAGCDDGGLLAIHGPATTFPADIPEVTAVGGTEFNEGNGIYWSSSNNTGLRSALSYIPEKAWNDTPLGYGIAAGGGGASALYGKPSWQTGPGVPNDGVRDVPDVSLAASGAHDGYVIFTKGGLLVVQGTSASAPAFAGIVTILNQYLAMRGSPAAPGLGNMNPSLYSLAAGTPGVFHDIATGSNIVPCAAGTRGCTTGAFGYNATPGYDMATGLGSVDAYKLVTRWNNP